MKKDRRRNNIAWMTVMFVAAFSLFGCGPTANNPQPISSPAAQVDEETAKKLAKQGFEKLGGALKERLQSALKDGGPVAAVDVCHEVAPNLASDISEELGFKVGRSSHRLRSPKNSPNPAIKDYLMKHSDSRASEVPVEASLNDGVWTVIAPIPTQPMCLTCHGDTESMDPKLFSVLKEKYPEDNAVGFKEGDLRGVFWAELPVR